MTTHRAETSVELRGDLVRPRNAYWARQTGIGPKHPCMYRALAVGLEMNDLTPGMHTGIGTSRANRPKTLIGNL